MQPVADTVGYSKASTFKRYGGKDELIERTLQRCTDVAVSALVTVDGTRPWPDRDRAALSALPDLLVPPAESSDSDRLLRAFGTVCVVEVLGLNPVRYNDERTARPIILESAVRTLG